MLLYFCISLVLINAVDSIQVNHTIRKDIANNVSTENVFANVIKNISRVNNVLQELINNYEQLQRIYKSQENVESGISDSEIDEVFMSKKKDRANLKKKTNKQPVTEKFGATQMFWSEDDDNNEDNNSQQSNSKENNKVNDTDSVNLTDHSANAEPEQYLPVTAKETTTLKHESSSESSDATSSSTSEEKPRKIHRVILKKLIKPDHIFDNNIEKKSTSKAEVQNTISSSPKPKAELIFIDTHKKLKEKSLNKNKAVVSKNDKIPMGSQIKKPKTRYSKVNNSLAAMNIQPYVKSAFKNIRQVKKVLRSEVFSPQKIWKDIINNKPILLEAHNEMNVFGRRNTEINPLKINTKSGKTALVIVTKKNNYDYKKESGSVDSDTIQEENEERALRKAYGDACLKVVVKKCFKANQKVSKSVCSKTKCKTVHKNTFKSFSKTACVDEFQARKENDSMITPKPQSESGKHKRNKKEENTSSEDSQSDMRYRGQESDTNTGFNDMTREGFLSAACFPYKTKGSKRSSLHNKSNQTTTDNMNILRDRFEKECQKVSTKKCRNACKYSYTNTCEKHSCSKRMRKLYKKSCKTECRKYYKITVDSGSSEDSDSDGEEDSGSEHSGTESE